MSVEIKAVIDKFCSGDENACFELVEIAGGLMPQLIGLYRDEPWPEVRALLVKAAWERREQSVIPFLGEALSDAEEEVWQEALDGLITLASTASSQVLQAARTRQFADEADHRRFHLWLEEAIQQVQFELQR